MTLLLLLLTTACSQESEYEKQVKKQSQGKPVATNKIDTLPKEEPKVVSEEKDTTKEVVTLTPEEPQSNGCDTVYIKVKSKPITVVNTVTKVVYRDAPETEKVAYYVARKGDTYYSICRQFNCSPKKVQRDNTKTLKAGQKVKISL